MAKKETWQQFDGVVCERMRRLSAKEDRLLSRREKLFKAKDKADADLNETGTVEKSKRDRLLADYGEAVRRIRDVDHKLKAIQKDLRDTMKHCDQAELFPDPDTFNAPAEEDEGEESEGGGEQLKLAQAGA